MSKFPNEFQPDATTPDIEGQISAKLVIPDQLEYPLWKSKELNGDLRGQYQSALGWLAFTLFGEEDYRAALEAFSEALSVDPDSPTYYEWRAACYVNLGMLEHALADFHRVAELTPDDVTAYNNRGVCHYSVGHIESALEDLNRAISLNPQYPNAYVNRARVYCKLKRYGDAQSNCDMALLLNADPNRVLAVQRIILEGLLDGSEVDGC